MTSQGINPDDCRFFEIKRRGRLSIYSMYFESISAVELFLKSNPPVNRDIFVTQVSEEALESFAGAPLKEAIAYCVGGYDENYEQFLELSQSLQSANKVLCDIKQVETAFVGHRPNVPAFIADAPKCMYRTKRQVEKKVINLFMQVTYDKDTTEKQILHRGILALNLIRLLEMNGYIVQFRLFESSIVYNEVFLCEVVLKKHGEKLDPRKCFYPMCGKGFVRRVLLRIKESIPFKENWHLSYGNVADTKSTKNLLQISDSDIYIGTPKEMGIRGEDMYEDADIFLEKLGLDDTIRVPRYK